MQHRCREPAERAIVRASTGFTLIELMIVVAIIAIIASIAIPNLLSSRKSANEASAISSMRALTTVMTQYRTRFGQYAPGIGALQARGYLAGFTPNPGGNFTKSGYVFFRLTPPNLEWAYDARPRVLGTTGDRFFWVDETGVIRWQSGVPAGPFSAPLEGAEVAPPPPPPPPPP